MNIYRYVVAYFAHTTFDGTNETITADGLATSCATNTVGGWSFWFNTSDVTPASNGRLLMFGDTDGDSVLGVHLGTTGEIQIQCRFNGSWKFAYLTISAPISNDTWHHVVVIQDGTNPKIYVDAVKISTTKTENAAPTFWNNDFSTLDNFRMGCRNYNSGGNTQFFDGSIDKVIVYDDVLTSGEITTIYNYGRKAGLIGIGNEVSQWELDTLNPVDVIQDYWTTFDGTNEYVNCGNDASLDFERTDAFSVSAWINADSTSSGYFVGKNSAGSGGITRGFMVGFEGSDKLWFQVMNSGANRLRASSTTTISTSNWYHVVFTYDGSSDISGCNLYVDNSAETLINTSNTLSSTISNSSELLIGGLSSIGSLAPFDGKIDKVIIYNDELTSGEVTTIYNYGIKAGLIGIGNEVSQWEMDALNPSDEIGSNDGTSTNMDSSNIEDNINDGTSNNMDSSNIVVG